ncbi:MULTISPECIES: hypothetical protein [unclassified Sphingomonas]|uniref:hypothetical protein n=1 Tax=unclassified Sphingomonas TaxID=196159 RepID=UPI0006F3C5DA|nr:MULTISPECIES: hypothetical protein [unclassified Sphingomonas]KQX19360.1 hypothetical protein ASD17_12525 [Sphingomonas sp. Root1294]KQY65563.1 hypothetical protein ASD39_15725 [Sphingomonas sp. Root50]KRB95136.1 hypothetical protein ASE22_04330 [Sphingomonas sp. Root720]
MSNAGDAVTTAILRAWRDGQPPASATVKAICDFPFNNRALADVLAERLDQIFGHGYDAVHDNCHPATDLPLAALTYLEDALTKIQGAPGYTQPVLGVAAEAPAPWPWRDFFRPADARTNMVKACALLLGAIDRLDAGDGAAVEERAAAYGAR